MTMGQAASHESANSPLGGGADHPLLHLGILWTATVSSLRVVLPGITISIGLILSSEVTE